jgi:hypothetical protein
MMPSPVAGSRLPVGSSARRISGRLTKARAIETRCCSPPDSWWGKALLLAGEADEVEHGGDLLADHVLRASDHLEREGDVLEHGLVRQQLVVLEDVADVAPQVGHLGVSHLVDVATRDPHLALLGLLLPVHQTQQRALARAGRPDEEDELRLRDVEAGVLECGDLGRVALGHVLELDHAGQDASGM